MFILVLLTQPTTTYDHTVYNSTPPVSCSLTSFYSIMHFSNSLFYPFFASSSAHFLTNSSIIILVSLSLMYTHQEQVPRLYFFIFTAYSIHPSKVRIHFDFLMKNKYQCTLEESGTSGMKIQMKKIILKFWFDDDEKINNTEERNFQEAKICFELIYT